jgi:dolichyl-phosphate-mannose-protein mannosyltransferase
VSQALARTAAVARRTGERPRLVVGTLFLLSAAVSAYFATKITTFQPDELAYTHLAFALGDRPSLWTAAFGGHDRLNQLYPLTLAPLYRLFGNVTAYELAHWWNALLMGSTVIPVYLLAREVLERRSAAYMAAAVAAVVPWLTLSSAQLTEVVAYPACAWALLAMQRALVRPSVRADLLALAAIAVAAYGRLQLGILAPVFVVAVLLHELGWAVTTGARGGGRARALREARRRVLRGHVVLIVAAGAGLAALAALVVAGRLQATFGFYGNTLNGRLLPAGTWSNAQANLTFLSWGLGVLPVAWTVGLALESAWAPRARRIHAFAVLATVASPAIVVSVARINVIFINGAVQERYVMFVVPLLVVGLLAGLGETRRPALALLLGVAVVAPLAATTDFQVTPSGFWFLVSPGMSSFLEVIAPRLGQVARALGDPGISRFAAGGYAIALGCLLLAAGIHVAGRRRRVVAGSVMALVFALCAATTVYSFHRVVYGSADYPGLGTGSVADRDWIDRAVGRDTPVVLLARQAGQVSDSRELWSSVEFWNRSVGRAYVLSRPFTTWHPGRDATLRPGRVISPRRARYVVLSTSGLPLELAGRELARSPDGKLRLVDTASRPLHARWTLLGLSDDGWLALQRPATLTIRGRAQRCRDVRLGFAVPRSLADARRVRVRGSGVDRTVVVRPQTPSTLHVRPCGAGPLQLTLTSLVPPAATAPGATVRVRSLAVGAA